MRLQRALLCSVVSALLAVQAKAQVASEVKGRVADASGAAIAGAQVTATELQTEARYTSVTGADGYFDFPNLVPGRYKLEALAPGFNPYVREGLNLAVGQTLGVDMPRPG